jgi:hypothetical protein
VQGLVTRGTYRSVDGPGTGLTARFQIAPNGYRFPAGHTVKLEVTANDAPYYQQSNVPAVVRVDAVRLTLPLLEPPATPAAGDGGQAAAAPAGQTIPVTGGGPPIATGLAALTLALIALRSRRAWIPAPRRRAAAGRD